MLAVLTIINALDNDVFLSNQQTEEICKIQVYYFTDASPLKLRDVENYRNRNTLDREN